MHNRLVSLSFILCAVLQVHAINFYRVNTAWQYDPRAPMKVEHRVVSSNQNSVVFFSLRSLDSLANWDVDFLIQQGYESESDQDLASYQLDTLIGRPYKVILRLEFPTPTEDLLVFRIKKVENFLYYDVPLKIGRKKFVDFYPVENDLPVLSNYINGENIVWEGNDEFYAFQYAENFKLAKPPMEDANALLPNVSADSSFSFEPSGTTFKDLKYYFVSKDSTLSNGSTYLKVPAYFPKYRKLPELVEPLFYITNEAEQESLLNSSNLKKAFDSFWINTYGSSFRAKKAIKKYYDAVEEANRNFTTFKQGWKTDRGMMYIVFGPPDEVYRQNNLEEWFYDEGIAIEYNIISTFFSSRTYSLRRKKTLEETWFNRIALIRRGANE